MAETHRVLLGAGIWIIEGLDLSRAPVGRCDFVCLPLRIVGSDGAPARAILRPPKSVRGSCGRCREQGRGTMTPLKVLMNPYETVADDGEHFEAA